MIPSLGDKSEADGLLFFGLRMNTFEAVFQKGDSNFIEFIHPNQEIPWREIYISVHLSLWRSFRGGRSYALR